MKPSGNPLVKMFWGINTALIALLVYEAVYFMFLGSVEAEVSSDYPGDSAALARIGSQAGPLEDYQEAVDRSLFNWQREPLGATDEMVDATFSDGVWELIGLVDTGVSTYALFNDSRGERQFKLEQGTEVDGWEISRITPEEVTLVNGVEEKVFRLSLENIPPKHNNRQSSAHRD
ncbi:hypothetical protein FV139_15875 [Parahaliea maris]|uniref:Type II secretion system protein GspC N-terminal domain-containing protein n=1 Tax=Parahaliea maris TaxID=2716870 RepID=A0A5C8ZU98_9GAMM|nr:hypothetical protein [Parahaliea maris]TXS91220.1 hypothetical protein FV139_15875 [Parahaliea maris]